MKGWMQRRIPVAGAVLLIFVLLVGAVSGPASPPKSYTMADSGSLVVAKNGETFVVALPENPSTGFGWNMTVSDGLKIVEDRYIGPATQIPGRGGHREWVIQAVEPGQQKVRGIYQRPWEPLRYNETTFRLDLEVTGSRYLQTFTNK